MSAVRASAFIAAVAIACAGVARAAPVPENAAARSAFQEGERDFQLGKFDTAIESYERAFKLDPQPAFIFNIALAHRRQFEIDGKLEHLLRARELYRNYLKLDPASPHRPGVEKLIAELGARIDQARAGTSQPANAAPAPAAPPPAPAPAPSPPPLLLTREPAIVATPSPPPEEKSSLNKWLLAGGITAVVIGAAVAILLVTRSSPAGFDGPGIDLTPEDPSP
jgi:tetratricopeptide (TPR) repeat protein